MILPVPILVGLFVAAPPLAQTFSDGTRCLPSGEVRVGPLAPADPTAAVAALGRSDSTAAWIEEDDGGWTAVAVYHVGPLRVEIVRDVVDQVWTASPDIEGPRGIHVGMDRGEVERRVGGPISGGRDAQEGWVAACDQSIGVLFQFDASGVLLRLSAVVERP